MNRSIAGAVKAIIENRDIDTLGEFFDWLAEQTEDMRRAQWNEVRTAFGRLHALVANGGDVQWRWSEFCDQLHAIFWPDLYPFAVVKDRLAAMFVVNDAKIEERKRQMEEGRSSYSSSSMARVPLPEIPAGEGGAS